MMEGWKAAMMYTPGRRTVLVRGGMLAAVAALAGCASGNGMIADPTRGRRPDGTVTLRMVQAAYLGSAQTGTGELYFNGRRYPFRISGGGIGGIGMSEVRASGEVYGLGDIGRFPGAYGEARTGFALGTVGQGQLWLENEAGVLMHLIAEREGLMLSFGADAMVIQLGE